MDARMNGRTDARTSPKQYAPSTFPKLGASKGDETKIRTQQYIQLNTGANEIKH